MDKKAERVNHGKLVYVTKSPYVGINSRHYADTSSFHLAKYILAEERFISGHDDSAGFVEIIDINDNVVKSWKFDYPMVKRFSDPDYYDDDCLILYLKETYGLPVIGYREPK